MNDVRLTPGTPTLVGSLPHTDPAEAAADALDLAPGLPAAPQLPRRHPREGMLAQVVAGMPGVTVAADGRTLEVDRRRLAAGPDGPLDAEAWAGTRAFLRAAAAAGHRGPVKVQVAGPVTVGLALVAGGAKPAKAFPVAAATVDARVRALLTEVGASLPSSPVVLVLDEPGLAVCPDASFPLGAEDTIDLLSGSLAVAGAGGSIAGVHCCGPTDWRLVLEAGPDLLSMPVDPSLVDDAAGVATFLERGGLIAWGAVPTDRPIGERDDAHWRRLTEVWCGLSQNGCDPLLLRTQALLTPACGLALHTRQQVAPLVGLVRRLSERVQDQAMAARMPAGA